MVNINDIIESIVVGTENVTPREISAELFPQIPSEEHAQALQAVLPAYVRDYLATRRVWKPVQEPAPVEEETYAPDDLLADDVQEIQEKVVKTKLRARGSARVNSIRTEWQRHYDDTLWNGAEYLKFGDATAVDLKGAAMQLRGSAEASIKKAVWYEEVASHLGDSKRVRDLTDDPTRA